MRPLRTFLWPSVMIHRTERSCAIERNQERYCESARTFACQCEEGLHNIFQPGFQCLMCQAFPVSLERCFHIPVALRVLLGGHAYPFIWKKAQFFHSQFSNPEPRLFSFIGDFCYAVSPLPLFWIVNVWPERESLGDGILKKNHTFSLYSIICP